MKIAIDGYEANVLQRLGSSQVAFELIRSLEKINRTNDYTVFLPDKPLDDLPKERNGFRYRILKPRRLWTRIALPIALYGAKPRFDIVFSPTHYIPRFSPSKRIAIIFDLSFLRFPEMFNKSDYWQLKNWTKFSAENAQAIITISQSSKRDICTFYKILKDKVIVAYPGYDSSKFNPSAGSASLTTGPLRARIQSSKFKEPYIIYVGTIQPRKNLIRLMEAVARIDDLKLLIVGKTSGLGRQGWRFEEILKTPKKLGIEDRVIFSGFAKAEDLPQLLSGALVFVLPSLYEGFGIPVLEAMACGVPVICSNISSLPEVCGKAGLLIDPYSVTQIEQAIRTIVADKKLRQKKIKEGLEQVKKFSWDKMAKEVLKVFEKEFQN